MSMLRALLILQKEDGEDMLGTECFWTIPGTILIVPGMISRFGQEKASDTDTI